LAKREEEAEFLFGQAVSSSDLYQIKYFYRRNAEKQLSQHGEEAPRLRIHHQNLDTVICTLI
jgi:hypothetical protein